MLAEHISKFEGQDILVLTEPDVLDWTNKGGKVVLVTDSVRIECPVPPDDMEKRRFFHALQDYIWDRDDITVVFWNLKAFMSYLYIKLGILPDFNGAVLDLKIAESFVGLRGLNPPATPTEAKNRILAVRQQGNWDKFIDVYQEVFSPLAMEVLPRIEAEPLADQRARKLAYASYEIEGTLNGRMKTPKALKQAYLPHNMGPDDRENLWPVSHADHFLYADYKNMEVAVLQWLSGDENLGEILDSDLDVYATIWKYVTQQEASEEQREACKKAFLAIVYGGGPKAVAGALYGTRELAAWFIEQIERHFPKTMEWVRNQMHTDGVFIDAFGRRIKLEPGKEYKLQNYAVSAPAAMICLHKLVQLHRELVGARLAFSVHDGFGILTDKYNVKIASKLARKILEAESEMYPGLRLKVACQSGARLNSLTHV